MKKSAIPAKNSKPKAAAAKTQPAKKIAVKPLPQAKSPKAKPAPVPARTESKQPETKAPPPGITTKEQTQLFEKAMQLFHKEDYSKAVDIFQKSTEGPSLEMRHAAQMHIKMCERRINAQAGPQTSDDHFTLGVSLMNRADYATAEVHLRKALAANGNADHYLYALALCLAHRGNSAEAASCLAKAIELEPQNRIAARNDAEFQSLSSQSAIRDVMYPERSNPGQS